VSDYDQQVRLMSAITKDDFAQDKADKKGENTEEVD